MIVIYYFVDMGDGHLVFYSQFYTSTNFDTTSVRNELLFCLVHSSYLKVEAKYRGFLIKQLWISL